MVHHSKISEAHEAEVTHLIPPLPFLLGSNTIKETRFSLVRFLEGTLYLALTFGKISNGLHQL